MKQLVVLLLLAGILWSDTLKVSYAPSNDEPFYFLDDSGHVEGGVVKDIWDELGRRIGVTVIYLKSPRKRFESHLETGRIHVNPLFNPLWSQDSTKHFWTVPIFHELDIVVHMDSVEIPQLSDLYGKTIGTILGYYYPGLMEFFEDSTMAREDALSLSANMGKLALGRVDAVIDSDIMIYYYLMKHPEIAYTISPFDVSSHEIRGAVSKRSPVSIDTLNSVIVDLRESGFIDSVLAQYR